MSLHNLINMLFYPYDMDHNSLQVQSDFERIKTIIWLILSEIISILFKKHGAYFMQFSKFLEIVKISENFCSTK